jgi:predicted nucleic acid-binding protein
MPRAMESMAKRPRISVDIVPAVRRRLRLAAARRDVTVRQYVLEAIEERLREDLGDEGEELLALNAKADPLLADLWDNRNDAAYDRLRSR